MPIGRAPRVLLACQAGTGVGLGHLSRTLVAARALQRLPQAEVQLLVQAEPLVHAGLAAFEHRVIPPGGDLAEAIDSAVADVLVLDLQAQRIPADFPAWLRRWRSAGRKLVAIDALLPLRAELDLVLMPTFHFVPPPGLPDGAPILHGWDCYLIDGDAPARPWQPGPRVLALTGGSDATHLGQHWPALIDAQLPDGSEVHWVTGPYAQPPALPARPRLGWREHVAPSGLQPLMRASDYAVTVYGVSFYELLHLGVPTVVFSPYGSKDNAELAAVAAAGVARVAADEREATQLLAGLMQDATQAATLSRSARDHLHTPGGERLARAIQALLT
ncbi:hypothetical protein [Roseateles asaccharophilus]|uniref:Spore coat polysaccharide biosynthesis predicted glycosyltransferase SpsG n=1 Tax=Roseateles asaccharophilus TaxID=582607 RepID=A0ABU2A9R3_9BURK|nr:hypothetical protein [Roseateles asaccharophilus]MDR7333941.1 spore coat polysaccharide biosynthesis predicted glycosyltransferase SpsG [Roseateles asaccharophilus]